MPKRVWVLGAGFSYSLGGPLLPDLLSVAAKLRLEATYPDQFDKNQIDPIFWLYHFGTGFQEGDFGGGFRSGNLIRPRGIHVFKHAEDFLELLDDAARDGDKSEYLTGVFERLYREASTAGTDHARQAVGIGQLGGGKLRHPSVEDLQRSARRIVAAAVSAFTEGVDATAVRSMERWMPYRAWIDSLGAEDTIVTFNYDRVIEIAAAGTDATSPRAIVPGPRQYLEEQVRGAADDEDPLLLKLHGSVDWVWNDDRSEVRYEPWGKESLVANRSIAIATPGPIKRQVTDKDGSFYPLWSRARKALSAAEEVYFVGYRFPETDAFARQQLLTALGRNDCKSLKLYTVLGHDIRSAPSQRLQALLRSSTGARLEEPSAGSKSKSMSEAGNYRYLLPQAMYAEDFLDTFGQQHRRT